MFLIEGKNNSFVVGIIIQGVSEINEFFKKVRRMQNRYIYRDIDIDKMSYFQDN